MYRVTARCSCFLLVATFCAIWFSPAVAADDPSGSRRTVVYRNLKSIRPAMINRDLKVGVPTVNVAIYLGETDGKPHDYVAAPDQLTASFERAKDIFAKAGVQLKLL